jgi:uncharacterized protein (TIGR02001 family)
MKHFTLAAALLAATAIAPTAFAQDSEISVSTGVDYVTEYVFRGVSFAGAAVQPYAEASVGDFTVGGWFSTAIGEDSNIAGDEFDLYAGYSVPLDSSISLDLGATYYHFPEGGDFLSTKDGNSGSYEVSASVGFGDVPLAPSVSAYYDFTFEAFTLEGSVGHSIPVGDAQSFDLGLTVGHVEVDGGSYEWATASASLGHSFTDDVAVYIGANYSLSSTESLDFERAGNAVDGFEGITDDKDKLWFGTGISAGF